MYASFFTLFISLHFPETFDKAKCTDNYNTILVRAKMKAKTRHSICIFSRDIIVNRGLSTLITFTVF